LIFDTRMVNGAFWDPEHVTLPTANAWAGLRTPKGKDLLLEQVDVEAAFYRVRTPAGLDDYFRLPPVCVATLLAVRPDLKPHVGDYLHVTPQLTVMPMGWSWALYFCQRIVEAQVLRAGFAMGDLVRDRHTMPDLDDQNLGAVYVDGAAVLGTVQPEVRRDISKVLDSLTRVGLKCKGIVESSDVQVFTGLCFERRSGRISLSTSRIWKLRLALLELLEVGWATGDQILRLLGHFTWGFCSAAA
jgi:hypothetical protein